MKLKVILISGLVVALTIWIGIEISDRITSDKQSFLTSEPVQTQTKETRFHLILLVLMMFQMVH